MTWSFSRGPWLKHTEVFSVGIVLPPLTNQAPKRLKTSESMFHIFSCPLTFVLNTVLTFLCFPFLSFLAQLRNCLASFSVQICSLVWNSYIRLVMLAFSHFILFLFLPSLSASLSMSINISLHLSLSLALSMSLFSLPISLSLSFALFWLPFSYSLPLHLSLSLTVPMCFSVALLSFFLLSLSISPVHCYPVQCPSFQPENLWVVTHDFFLVHLLRDPAVAVAVAVVAAVAVALRVAYVGVILVRGGFLRESEGVGVGTGR